MSEQLRKEFKRLVGCIQQMAYDLQAPPAITRFWSTPVNPVSPATALSEILKRISDFIKKNELTEAMNLIAKLQLNGVNVISNEFLNNLKAESSILNQEIEAVLNFADVISSTGPVRSGLNNNINRLTNAFTNFQKTSINYQPNQQNEDLLNNLRDIYYVMKVLNYLSQNNIVSGKPNYESLETLSNLDNDRLEEKTTAGNALQDFGRNVSIYDKEDGFFKNFEAWNRHDSTGSDKDLAQTRIFEFLEIKPELQERIKGLSGLQEVTASDLNNHAISDIQSALIAQWMQNFGGQRLITFLGDFVKDNISVNGENLQPSSVNAQRSLYELAKDGSGDVFVTIGVDYRTFQKDREGNMPLIIYFDEENIIHESEEPPESSPTLVSINLKMRLSFNPEKDPKNGTGNTGELTKEVIAFNYYLRDGIPLEMKPPTPAARATNEKTMHTLKN